MLPAAHVGAGHFYGGRNDGAELAGGGGGGVFLDVEPGGIAPVVKEAQFHGYGHLIRGADHLHLVHVHLAGLRQVVPAVDENQHQPFPLYGRGGRYGFGNHRYGDRDGFCAAAGLYLRYAGRDVLKRNILRLKGDCRRGHR